MIDRTTKALLVAIAAGIWLTVLSLWLRGPAVHDEQVLQELQSVHDDLETLSDRLSDLLEQFEEPDDSGGATPSGAGRPGRRERSVRPRVRHAGVR